jgi:hypothetical protein
VSLSFLGWKIKKKIKTEASQRRYEYLAEECARRSIEYALSNPGLIAASSTRQRLEKWVDANW